MSEIVVDINKKTHFTILMITLILSIFLLSLFYRSRYILERNRKNEHNYLIFTLFSYF